jgi:hypothetical protein
MEIAFTRTGPSSRAIAFTNPSRPQFTMLVVELFGAGRPFKFMLSLCNRVNWLHKIGPVV